MQHDSLYDAMNRQGYALIPSFISGDTCKQLREQYADASLYRSTINMQRYRFGKGEYRYFNYPLPQVIEQIRKTLYPPLAVLANDWAAKIKWNIHYPEKHEDFIAMCHAKNQLRPTPLILRYEKGGFNTLHQDLYGEIYFPFQVVFVLSQSDVDFTGGEFVLTEQIPRAQSKAIVLKPNLGDVLVFTTHSRPMQGTRGYYRVNMKHGVSEVTSGQRYALGVIFHDAA